MEPKLVAEMKGENMTEEQKKLWVKGIFDAIKPVNKVNDASISVGYMFFFSLIQVTLYVQKSVFAPS